MFRRCVHLLCINGWCICPVYVSFTDFVGFFALPQHVLVLRSAVAAALAALPFGVSRAVRADDGSGNASSRMSYSRFLVRIYSASALLSLSCSQSRVCLALVCLGSHRAKRSCLAAGTLECRSIWTWVA